MKSSDCDHKPEDIAIIGMAGAFPRAGSIRDFWQNIVDKVDAITDPPEGSLLDRYFDPESPSNDRISCKRGGYLDSPLAFYPTDFGIMPVAVDGALPEHFMALQMAHAALADAGYPDCPLDRERTEVILGRGTFINRGYVTLLQHGFVVDQTVQILRELHPEMTDGELSALKARLKESIPPFSAETAPGLVDTILAGIISNRLDLKGSSMVVDGACASGLLALEVAMGNLRSRKCDAALIGAVQVSTPHLIHLLFSRLGALTRHSHLRPFDQSADGTMLGQGIGMVVLKRKEDAIRDGHRIYALVKGVGSASDGRGRGLTAPRVEGEELALRRAYAAAGVDTRTIGLIEAHGTAMPLGDLTEIQALGRVFGPPEEGGAACALGTVKSMIGHLLPAAGVAGLIKASLALYHKTLPPTINCETPNPKFELDRTRFYLNTRTRPWIHGEEAPRRAAVNAFGFGGINAHAILEEQEEKEENGADFCRAWETELLVLEAESRAGLLEAGRDLLRFLEREPQTPLADLAWTVNSSLAGKSCRLAVVAASLQDLVRKLEHSLERLADPQRKRIQDKSGIYFHEEPLAHKGRLAFLFPGEGSQYVDMLSDLCLHFPVVRACFDTLDRAFAGHERRKKPSDCIFPRQAAGQTPEGEKEALFQMDYAVDAVLAADRALFYLFRRLGIQPDVIAGHSSGEIMALEAAEAIRLAGEEERIRHIQSGNRMIENFARRAAIPEAPLIAVGANAREAAHALVEESPATRFIAMDNCPNQLVMACALDEVETVMTRLRQAGAICQRLPFARPYHTPLFAPASRDLKAFLGDIVLHPPTTRLYSCKTAAPMPPDPAAVSGLAIEQWTHPVRFRETVAAMHADGIRLFVEIGPRANLTSFVTDTLRKKPHLAVAANVHHRSGITQLHHALGMLAAHGTPMTLAYLYERRGLSRVDLAGGAESRTTCDQGPKGKIDLHLELPVLTLGQDARRLAPGAISRPAAALPREPEPREIIPSPRSEIHAGDSHAKTSRGTPAAMSPKGRAPFPESRSRVMNDHFQTMEKFLTVQQEVMEAYLNAGAPRQSDAHSAAADVMPAPAAFAQVLPRPAVEPEPAAKVPVESPAPEGARSREALKTLLLAEVSAKTGYPAEMIRLDQNLEADLGIDSIKRVEILTGLQEKTGLLPDQEMDRLNRLHTLKEIIDALAEAPAVAGEDTAAGADPDKPPSAAGFPLLGEVLALVPGQSATVVREFSLEEDLFLLDHALGRSVSDTDPELTGLPIMPLTMSIEMLAETAALLCPGQVCAGMRDIRAYRWISFEEGKRRIRMEARAINRSEIRVQIREEENASAAGATTLPIAEAIAVFADTYGDAPAPREMPLTAPRPSAIPPDRLYAEGMFMGPAFQGVAALEQVGENGIHAALQVLSRDGFFRSHREAAFVLDPVLLDAAGQLLAYWIVHHREVGFNAYPYRIAKLDLFGPCLAPGLRLTARAVVSPLAENQLRADIEVLGPDGRLYLRVSGWEDRLFDLPAPFHTLRYNPREVMLSRTWQQPFKAALQQAIPALRRLDDFPHRLLHAHGLIWHHCLTHLAFGRKERADWQRWPVPPQLRSDWLLALVAGKDAVRQVLKARSGTGLCLTDVAVAMESCGAELREGGLVEVNGDKFNLSLAAAPGVGVALVADFGRPCGIAVQWMENGAAKENPPELTPEELRVLDSLPAQVHPEWLVRIACARKAAQKALGSGWPSNPCELALAYLEPDTGVLGLETPGSEGGQAPRKRSGPIQVYTSCDGGLVAAWMVLTEEP